MNREPDPLRDATAVSSAVIPSRFKLYLLPNATAVYSKGKSGEQLTQQMVTDGLVFSREVVDCIGPAIMAFKGDNGHYNLISMDRGSAYWEVGSAAPVLLSGERPEVVAVREGELCTVYLLSGNFEWTHISIQKQAEEPFWDKSTLLEKLMVPIKWKEPLRLFLSGRINDQVFADLADIATGDNLPPAEKRRMELVHQIRQVVDVRFRESLILKDLARSAATNAASLKQLFKRVYGMTVKRYQTCKRIAYACHRMQTTQDPVGLIVYASGYRNVSHFTRVFHKMTGAELKDLMPLRRSAGK